MDWNIINQSYSYDIVQDYFKNCNLLDYKLTDGYYGAGDAYIICQDGNNIIYFEWSWGSCSGCTQDVTSDTISHSKAVFSNYEEFGQFVNNLSESHANKNNLMQFINR